VRRDAPDGINVLIDFFRLYWTDRRTFIDSLRAAKRRTTGARDAGICDRVGSAIFPACAVSFLPAKAASQRCMDDESQGRTRFHCAGGHAEISEQCRSGSADALVDARSLYSGVDCALRACRHLSALTFDDGRNQAR